MSYSGGNNYYDAALLAREIANKIGHSIIRDGYYSDEYLGKKYTYEGLQISYYDNNNTKYIHIFFNNIEVLGYDFNSGNIKFIEGRWVELINAIYNQIPTILYERKVAEDEINNKITVLRYLEKYFKEIIIFDKSEGFLARLNNYLSDYGILISKEKTNPLYRNNVTGDYEESAVSITSYKIYSDNRLVAKFNGSQFNVFPNINHTAKSFVMGEWIDIFKYFVNQAVEEQKSITRQSLDSSASELLKKFKYNN